MHACGHDMHMTCFIGTARWLAEHKDRWSGTVVLIGQPAEEAIGGARNMLDDGLYTRFPKPDFALALHCHASEPAGDVCYRPGPLLASSTSLAVTIRGKGGHGAWPHRTVDPIVLAALAVLDFQTIVSREVEPIQPAVVTVGSIHGGTKHNIISDEVKLQLTLRAFSEQVRLQLIEGIERRVKALAEAHKAPAPTVEVEEYTPATINSPELVERVVPFLKKALGDRARQADRPGHGGRGLRPLRRGQRADHDVLAGHDVPRADRRGQGQGNRPARPALGPLPSRAAPEHRHRHQGHDQPRWWACCRQARDAGEKTSRSI